MAALPFGPDSTPFNARLPRMHILRSFFIPLCLLAFCSELCAAGAIGKPRFKNEIAFNEVLRLEFSTLLSSNEQVDISGTIINAMDMSNNRNNWLLAEKPAVTINNKSRYVKIQLSLLPRQTGTLRLPEIPLSWLDDPSIPDLGHVDVREHIVIGNHTQPLPSEIESVGGFAWKMSAKDLQKKLGKADKVEQDGVITYTTRDGLALIVRQGKLSGARIQTNGWYLRQARFNFIDRWGQPRENALDAEQPHLSWVIGWLHIHASETVIDGKPQVTVNFSRQDIDARLLTDSIDKQVFKLLESDQTSDELWSKNKNTSDQDSADADTDEQASEADSSDKKVNKVQEQHNTPQAQKREELAEPEQKPVDNNVSAEMLDALFKEAQQNQNK